MENIVKDPLINDVERSINFIKDVVCSYYNLDNDIYESKSRQSNLVKAKHIAIFIAKKQLSLTLVDVGNAFKFDHSNIVYIVKKIEGYIEFDPRLRKEIEEIQNIIRFKATEKLRLEQDYYYIPLNEFSSIKPDQDKAVLFKGFSEEELNSIVIFDKRTGKPFFKNELEIRKHYNQNFYILEKLKEDSKKENQENTITE
jgi:hypothetical protein